jgi:tetratricopeptide (TPR) repeat protein
VIVKTEKVGGQSFSSRAPQLNLPLNRLIEQPHQPAQSCGLAAVVKEVVVWQRGRLRTLPIALLLWVSSSGAVAAQTPGPSLEQSIDHAAACGLLQLGKEFLRALEHCDRALQDNPGDHSTLLNRGSAHLALGNLDEALSDFEKAIEMKPEDPRNYFNRALVHGAKKDHRRAIADYGEAIRIMPSLAYCLQQQGLRTRSHG